MGPGAKNSFYIFKWLKESQENKISPRYTHLVYVLPLAASLLQRQNSPHGLKYLLLGPLQKKFADLSSRLVTPDAVELHDQHTGSMNYY